MRRSRPPGIRSRISRRKRGPWGRFGLAAQVHHAMGRIFIEQLGDASSAATCYQNAVWSIRSTARRWRRRAGCSPASGVTSRPWRCTSARSRCSSTATTAPESLRAQALLLRSLGRVEDANRVIDDALQLAPDHPALLKSRVQAAERDGDRALTASLLVRSAGATRDPVYKATLLRRAVLILEALGAGFRASAADRGRAARAG